jgi:mannosyltransferase
MLALSRRSVGARRLAASPRLFVLLDVLLAALLSILYIGDDSLWLDEGISIAIAGQNLSSLFETLEAETYQVLYYVLLHFWLRLGDSEAFIRTLSALFAVATIPVAYALGSRLFDTKTGLIAALLLSLHPLLIDYAQEVRGYTLYVFLITAAAYAFVRAIEEGRTVAWIAYVLLGSLAVYTHLFASLVLFAHAASLVFLRRESLPWRSLVLSGAGFLILLLPLAVLTLRQSVNNALGFVDEPTRLTW